MFPAHNPCPYVAKAFSKSSSLTVFFSSHVKTKSSQADGLRQMDDARCCGHLLMASHLFGLAVGLQKQLHLHPGLTSPHAALEITPSLLQRPPHSTHPRPQMCHWSEVQARAVLGIREMLTASGPGTMARAPSSQPPAGASPTCCACEPPWPTQMSIST